MRKEDLQHNNEVDIRPENLPTEFGLTEKVVVPWLRWQRKEQGVPGGIAFSVVHNGRIAFSGGVGSEDPEAEKPKPMTETTPLGIGSLTKSFTAVMTGQLVEEGSLDVTTRVADIIPEFNSIRNPISSLITVDHLLHHTSGIRRDGNTNHGPDAN